MPRGPGKYAQNTGVSVERSKAEIERLVSRYGATAFSSAWQDNMARVEFMLGGRHIRISLTLPSKEEFEETERGRKRKAGLVHTAWEKGCRELWRGLVLLVHAKLVAVESGLSTIDREFMPDVLLPDGKTIGDHLHTKIEAAYSGGKVKGLLPEFL